MAVDLYANPLGLHRADGKGPYNGFFWPLSVDEYNASDHLVDRRLPFDNRLTWLWVVRLDNGRWLSEGRARSRQFDTRELALRSAAARMLRCLRAANRRWTGAHRISDEMFAALVGWVYAVLDAPEPKFRSSGRLEPERMPIWSNLPLLMKA